MAILDDVKIALRISNTAYDAEISDLISAAQADLGLSGVLSEKNTSTDPLIKRAIVTYCKANFGWDNPDASRLQDSYNMIKNHITLSKEYAYHTITFAVTDAADETIEIRQAAVTFNGETKYTDESGQAVFYVLEGSNYLYEISAEGYHSDAGADNLLDVTASDTVEIALTGV